MNSLKVPSLQSLLESDRGSNDSLLAESLQLDIEELDDIEYSIPPLNSVPTLENVLTDLDGDSETYSEIGLNTTTPTPSMDDQTASVTGLVVTSTGGAGESLSHNGHVSSNTKCGTILRHVAMQGISSQISSAADRVNAGLASSLDISDTMTAVGTSHGHILTFDSQQALRWCCQEFSSQGGAVSALAFNADSTRLLAGFARGHICMLDTGTGDVIRTMTDVITPNSGVLNIRWTENTSTAMCSDSGGSVWTLTFTRRMGIRGCDSRCIFSGARGEVCTIEPLLFRNLVEHPLRAYCTAAMATLSKFVVVTIRPRLKVIKFHALNGPADNLPLLAWQMVLIQSADSSRSVDPVLCVSRGSNIYFHQICLRNGKISLLFLRHISLAYNLVSLHWLGPKTICGIDTTEILHLYDVRGNKELETVDMMGAGMVYGSAQFKGFATGGNVSPALALAGTYACYNSIKSHANRVYILGGRSLHAINCRSWSDRISHLVSNQKWTEACQLAVDGYRSAAGNEQRKARRQIAHNRTIHMIEDYLQATHHTPDYCLEAVMNCLIEIGEVEMLYQDLWERLIEPKNYLIYLTEFIDCGRLKEIAPVVAQSLCDYWLHKNPDRLEEIILKLDWKCLDLHQVLTATRKEKLYQAQIYLNSQALGDYCASLTDLIPLILVEDRKLGNYLLVYISGCLAGLSYPSGYIPKDMVATVKHEILRCLTSIHSLRAPDDELPYPYLRALLKFDIRDTLNVLSLAFQEREFTGELGQSHRQRIVHILLEIMSPRENDEETVWSDMGSLLNFIAQQIAIKSLPMDSLLLSKVVQYLRMEKINYESLRQHLDRENAWLELLKNDCLSNISMGEQLRMSQAARCYRVVEFLLEKRKSYDDTLEMCYLPDPRRHDDELWTFIEKYADNNSERQIYEQIQKHFLKLLIINCDRLTGILLEYFFEKIPNLIAQLKSENTNGRTDTTANNHQIDEQLNLFQFLDNLYQKGYKFEQTDCDSYINLLCKYSPERVESFLRNSDNNLSCPLDRILEIVKSYSLFSACIYLYEKQGDYQTAFNVSLDLLKKTTESSTAAEESAIEVCQLCVRASVLLSAVHAEELWFAFIKVVLERPDLGQVTRNILYACSGHVDVAKLMKLILHSGSVSSGHFGDIKHLLLGLLSNSKYETFLLKTTAKIFGADLNKKLIKEKLDRSRGVAIKSIKCVQCRIRLSCTISKTNLNSHVDGNGGGGGDNDDDDDDDVDDGKTKEEQSEPDKVVIFGRCGHAVHEKCFHQATKHCPRCGTSIVKEYGQ